MKQLLETKFFLVMNNFPSLKQGSSILEDAYDELVRIIFAARGDTTNMNDFYNSLCYLQIELKSLREQPVKMVEKKYSYAPFRESHIIC